MTMEEKKNLGKYLAVQFNINGNMTDQFCSDDEELVGEWAKSHTEGAKRCVIYTAVLRTRLVHHVELDDYDNPEQKPYSV